MTFKEFSLSRCETCSGHPTSVFKEMGESGLSGQSFETASCKFSPGEPLMFERDGEKVLYCIRSGHVKQNAKKGNHDSAVHIAGPGEIIGFDDPAQPPELPAVALGEVEACYIRRTSFMQLLRNSWVASQVMFKNFMNAIWARDEMIVGLASLSLRSRVASVLLHLNSKFGASSPHGSMIDVKIDRATLAELSGTVVESLARVLTEFETENIIRRRGRRIFVVDAAKLQEIASG